MVDLGNVAVDVAGMRPEGQARTTARTWKCLFVCSSVSARRVQTFEDYSTPTPTTAFWVAFIATITSWTRLFHDIKRRDLAEPYFSRFTTLAMFLYVFNF